jgi:hypothetical protein
MTAQPASKLPDTEASASAMRPDRTIAEQFLVALDPQAEGFTFQTFNDDRDREDGSLARILHGTLAERWMELVQLNNNGSGIFVTVNATDLKGRKSDNVTEVRALFVDLARDAKRLDVAAGETTAQLRGVQHDIRERLRAKGLRKVVADGVVVTWSSVKGRPSYDMKAIREAAAKAGIDVAKYETAGDRTDRLVITTTPPRAA